MVKSVTGLTGNGVRDFIVQRLSAYVLFFYFLWFVLYCTLHSPMNYAGWKELFSMGSVKAGTLLAVLSLVFHSWVGMWTIFTDYIHCVWIRSIIMLLTFGSFLVYVAWTVQILWG
jgi:succinate dehydrogenase / fumarate reductase, membrane anchor subunit